MKKSDQQVYRFRLLELRERLLREVTSSEEALREDVVSPGTGTHLPTHAADHDVEGLDVQIEIAQSGERMLEEVEDALQRIDAGTYGTCQKCGHDIPRDRLEAVPYAALCIACAQPARR